MFCTLKTSSSKNSLTCYFLGVHGKDEGRYKYTKESKIATIYNSVLFGMSWDETTSVCQLENLPIISKIKGQVEQVKCHSMLRHLPLGLVT